MEEDNVVEMEDNLKEIKGKLGELMKRGPKALGVLFLLILLLWGATGIYTVDPGEQGVVLQFGKVVAQTSPGLRYRLPWPIQSHEVVDVATVRRIEIGYRTERTGSVPAEALMLTGDENIVKIHLFVQYRVVDPAKFLFQVKDPETTLHSTTEVALRSIVGQNTIDFTMTEGRVEVQENVQSYIQKLLDYYGTGIVLIDVRLLTVDPPDQVKDAFNEVVRAWEDKERLVQEARGYMEDLLPRARGEAEAIIREAEAYQEQRVLRAQGDVAYFLQVLDVYESFQEVTRERLYLEAVKEYLPKTRRFIIHEASGNALLQFLPLTEDLNLPYDRGER